MSQQINLLPAEKLVINQLLLALAVLSLVVLGVLAAWGINHFRISAAQEKLAASELELRETRAALQQRIDAKTALLAKIEATRPLAVAAEGLGNTIKSVGNNTGFSAYFSTLADGTEDGIWLTQVTLANTQLKQIDGQSLNSEAVIRFSQNLNTLFASQGMKFTSVDLTPQTIVPTGGRPPLSSTKFVIR